MSRSRSSGPAAIPPAAAGVEVGVVGGLDLGRPLEQQVGGGEQRGVLRRRSSAVREQPARRLGPSPELLDGRHAAQAYPLTARSSRGVSARARRASLRRRYRQRRMRSRQDDEVVAVDDFVGQAFGEVGGAPAGDRCAAAPAL